MQIKVKYLHDLQLRAQLGLHFLLTLFGRMESLTQQHMAQRGMKVITSKNSLTHTHTL